jgi:hypothetical protein
MAGNLGKDCKHYLSHPQFHLFRQLAEGKNVLEVKLRKTNDGLLKHFNMGKTRNSLESYRFDVLISDRQVIA